jgi:molecular chaperone GrpE
MGHKGKSKEAAGSDAVAEDLETGEAETVAPQDDGAAQRPTPGTPAVDVDRGETLDDPAQRLAEELEAVNERYLRLAAEFENFRKRTQRERAELSTFAQAELTRRLLPTLDDLARVSQTPPETTTVEALDAGLDLILKNLRKELEEAGLIRIEALGERFDPELHQAVLTAATDEAELDDTVSRVFVDGYVFRDRLVRPAQVEVLSYSPEGDG